MSEDDGGSTVGIPNPREYPDGCSVNCVRCPQPATKGYEGDERFLDLCDDCFESLRRWLVDGE